ncbi:MAG: ABC transporter ATP-binding protein [Candidatus Eremiobacteraeota bacterium]|nr:ABC transporter ATP-binding protein [Candidatus Eremiobacteraeota bacterium]MBV8367148.1 ABC transporter ATP-binding protein [Candidatus Eremiobacteraeota bacterium]
MAQDGAVLLTATRLVKEFAGFRAVDGVDLRVPAGATLAIIGPNGAGKTTLFNLLSGFVKPSAGSIAFNGNDITELDAASVARLGLVRSFQITSVFPHVSVRDNVKIALLAKHPQARSFWDSASAADFLDEPADALLDKLRLSAHADRLAAELPYGRKRALELAVTLALDPLLLLLDEPTSGLGTEDVDPIIELVAEAAQGRTVVLVEHNMNVVERLAQHVVVLQYGKVICEGSYASVHDDARVVEAYLGGIDA